MNREPAPSVYFIGEHSLIRRINPLVRRVAVTDATVLMPGESGTGKEAIARSLHNLCPRAHRPFVPINCAAVPHKLLETELFGQPAEPSPEPIRPRTGMFQLADGGTIFLDAIGEFPLALQPKLLRCWKRRSQAGESRPIGVGQRTRDRRNE